MVLWSMDWTRGLAPFTLAATTRSLPNLISGRNPLLQGTCRTPRRERDCASVWDDVKVGKGQTSHADCGQRAAADNEAAIAPANKIQEWRGPLWARGERYKNKLHFLA
jgi:hypothetical protein